MTERERLAYMAGVATIGLLAVELARAKEVAGKNDAEIESYFRGFLNASLASAVYYCGQDAAKKIGARVVAEMPEATAQAMAALGARDALTKAKGAAR